MEHRITTGIYAASILLATALSPQALTQTNNGLLDAGQLSASVRIRYENVDQDNALKNASALTLRSALQFKSKSVNDFSALVEIEDVRIVAGIGDYSVPVTAYQPGEYSVIADPASTEINQAFVQYINDSLTLRAGRQMITHDRQRFVGAVGWRQDSQVFDALSLSYNFNDKLTLSYNFIDQRKRIFADAADINSNDHLFHATYDSSIGTISSYAYLLEASNTASNSNDTYGIRLDGATKAGDIDISYLAEYASQNVGNGPSHFTTDYTMLEAGFSLNWITTKLGQETLGSDQGVYAFSTPLATAHAFNGWADTFLNTPAQGLKDLYLTVISKVLGGKLTATYHDFSADNAPSALNNLGSEVNIQFTKAISDHYTVGLKYADYREGDIAATPDTQKVWLWFEGRF